MKNRRTNNGVISSWIIMLVRRTINLKKRKYNAMKKSNTVEACEQYLSRLKSAKPSFANVRVSMRN